MCEELRAHGRRGEHDAFEGSGLAREVVAGEGDTSHAGEVGEGLEREGGGGQWILIIPSKGRLYFKANRCAVSCVAAE